MNPDLQEARPLRIKSFLDLAIARKASDLHLVVGRPPILRVQGSLLSLDLPVLEADFLKDLIYEILIDRQKAQLRENKELDFSYHYLNEYFFRVNVHMEKGYMGATIRIMPGMTRTLEALGLPPVVAELSMRRSGLILIAGRAGMGKTTTMTHMVDYMNHNRQAKIVTVEDPIEFVHQSQKSLIIQREVGADTLSFGSGLRHALRQDPDVIVIGETRDLDSISMALTAAETGHLVLATLHAPDAIEAINRIIDVYPGDKQNQIRVQLAENLLAVISQQLLPMKDSVERVLASEILVANMAIRNLIRRNVLPEIRGQMETGREGMCTSEQSLSRLVARGAIDLEVARAHAKYPDYIRI